MVPRSHETQSPSEKEKRTDDSLKRATQTMHQELAGAVSELRRRLDWGQAQLAKAIRRELRGSVPAPYVQTISRWETGERSPSPVYRMALSRIAAKHGFEGLARRFRASVEAWALVGEVLHKDEKP
jgi:DNA-binding transcriptional regulator YiaG